MVDPETPLISIDMVADPVCPWCYIGEHRLRQALDALSGEARFELRIKPFELNPELPAEGTDHRELIARKFGSHSRVQAIHDELESMGRREGVEFRFDKVTRAPNTFQAHRLIWLAGREGMQTEVLRSLFRAYFVEGTDLGNPEELVRLGTGLGMSPVSLKEVFSSQEGAEEVRQMEEQAISQGITGVPALIIEDSWLIRGAQTPDLLTGMLRQILSLLKKEEEKKTNGDSP